MICDLWSNRDERRVLAVVLVVMGLCLPLAARKKRPNGPGSPACKAYFVVAEQDSVTVNLPMVGLNDKQADWYRKHGGDFPILCLVNADPSGKRTVAKDSPAFDSYLDSVVGTAPLYMIVWEEHRLFVPDGNGGHYAWSASGVLSAWDPVKKDFAPLFPLHNTNHTILTSSSVSLLKDGLREISERER